MSLLIEIEITLEWENLRKITRGIKKQTLGRGRGNMISTLTFGEDSINFFL